MFYKKHIKLTKKKFYFIFSLGFFLFLFMFSAPNKLKEHVRFFFLDKFFLFSCFNKPFNSEEMTSLDQLRAENYFLRQEVSHLRSLLLVQDFSCSEVSSLVGACNTTRFFPARVIFRDPFSWGSSFWINVGEQNCSSVILKKNSPVVIGPFLLGVVDYVGKNQSRVRLITDVGVTPSVCVIEEDTDNLILRSCLKIVLQYIKRKKDEMSFFKETSQITSFLLDLEKKVIGTDLKPSTCRGILCGTGSPLWKKHRNLLKGCGFCIEENNGMASFIKENDILITTGLDGIFPSGLLIAKVSRVLEKKEGGYSYNLEAEPLIDNFDDISNVLVLPPVSFSKEDVPSLFRFLNSEEN